MRRRLAVVLVLAASLVPTGGAWGDLLSFRQGGRADLPARVEGNVVAVTMPAGVRSFPRAAFRSIEPTPTREAAWATRRAEAGREGSAASWFAAGWWALGRGWVAEAASAFDQARTLPGADRHAPLTRVGRILDRLRRPAGEADLGPTLRVLGGSRWEVLPGRHVTLIHQASEADARQRLDHLDAVVEAFYLTLAGQGVDLHVPDVRLVSAWFANRAEYVACLRRADAVPFANTQGYYHPTLRSVLAYDTRSNPDQAEARRALDAAGARDLDPGRAADRERRRLLLDLDWLSIDLAIAAHETAHQVAAASGLAPRFDDFPHWLHEGFAAQFEGVRDGRWVGIGPISTHRLPDWRPAALLPLLHDDGLTQGYRPERYAQAGVLVAFLRRTRPEAFVDFLDLLRAPRPDGRPAPVEDAFRAAFGGDLAALQIEWHRFARDLVDREADRLAGRPQQTRR